jgi:HPt (histidine-containing phosphotransfer) domain-containing protein
MMASFRQDYLDLLDGRVDKITGLLAAQETEPAVVALLSLESSSAMVGAHDLAAAGRRLRDALGTGDDLTPLTDELAAEAVTARGRLAPAAD